MNLERVQRSLLTSLHDRMQSDPRLRGLVSPLETDALGWALGFALDDPTTDDEGGAPAAKDERASDDEGAAASATALSGSEAQDPPSLPEPSDDKVHAAPEPTIDPSPPRMIRPGPRPAPKLVLDALDAPPMDDVVMCLDFGTAHSKVGLVRGGREVLPLALDGDGWFTVEASLYADEAGLHVGGTAVKASLARRRPRMDSLKRVLGRLPLEQDPERTELLALGVSGAPPGLTLADAMVATLSWLTHRARTAARSQHGLQGRLLRRFALPCWPSARWLALKPVISRWMAEAEILADTLGDDLAESPLPPELLRTLRGELAELDRRPTALVGRAVSEPVAAAASRFGPDSVARGLVLVVDVGAGTTDLAVFVVDADPDEARFEILPIEGASDVLGRAGDTIDRALLQLMHRKRGGRGGRRELELTVRRDKERLLRKGHLRLEEDPTVELTRGELLEHPDVAGFETLLRERIRRLLNRLPEEAVSRWADAGLRVCLAGGGAHLPMVAQLTQGETEVRGRYLRHRAGPELPAFVASQPELRAVYARLAVALGGASGYLPREGRAFAVAGTVRSL